MSKVILKTDHFLVDCQQKVTKYSYDRILTVYFEEGLSVLVRLNGKKKHLPITFSKLRTALIKCGFIQIGRTQIINKTYIAGMDLYKKKVQMMDGTIYTISRRRLHEVSEAWIQS